MRVTENIGSECAEMRRFCKRLEEAAGEGDDVELFGRVYTPLPLDADGLPVNVGDVMKPDGSALLPDTAPFEVRALQLHEVGWDVFDRMGDRYAASHLRHHHEPTIEDVLLKVCSEYHALMIEGLSGIPHEMPAPSEIIAKYAEMLQLKEAK